MAVGIMTFIPLFAATVDQAAAYARYVIETRDLAALVWGLLFLAICLGPALVLDVLLLPVRLYEAVFGRSASAAAHSRGEPPRPT